jgi:acyl dehydratase
MGLLTVGYLATFLEGWVGRDSVERLSTRFLAPVWPGERVVCTGRRSADGGSVELQVANEAGEVKATGSAELRKEVLG